MQDRDVFLAALDIPEPAARRAYLDEACAAAPDLRARVERLLLAHAAAGRFLEQPLWEQLGEPATGQFAAEDPLAGLLEPSAVPGSLGRLGRYEVQAVLGRGGFGTVVRAFDESLQRLVAIKLMHPELAATSPARKRFLREARAAAAIRNEHVVQIYGVEEQPVPYLVMEYVPGLTLEAFLKSHGPLDVRDVLRLGRQIALGLAAAHAIGLVHRDVKPANILLENGAEGRARLTDFGLARAVDDASLTQSGVLAGTPMYMSPEQANGWAVDSRSDLFSLGSVLYQMVSGRPPFRAETTPAVLRRVAEDAPRPIPEIIPETPEWLCTIISKLHARQPDDRFQSAHELADALWQCEQDLEQSRVPKHAAPRPASPPSEPTRIIPAAVSAAPRSRWRAATAALVLVGVLAALGVGEAAGVTQISSTVIRITLGEGTLVIESSEPGLTITLNGEEVQIRGTGVQELRVRPGTHTVVIRKDGAAVKEDLVQITRGGRQVLRLSPDAPAAAHQPVFTVTSTADAVDDADGVLTLREALLLANRQSNAAEPDRIHFEIPQSDPGYRAGTGTFTIRPQSGLPSLTDAVVIDGWTQPGWQAAPLIELDGRAAGVVPGLAIGPSDRVDGSTVRGLVINHFRLEGIRAHSGAGLSFQGNYIGTDVTGALARPNGSHGIDIEATRCLIGTDGDGVQDLLERNVISGNNRGTGVNLRGRSENHVIAGNLIGLAADGSTGLGNQIGVSLSSAVSAARLGTNADGRSDEAERNVISANTSSEVHIGDGHPAGGRHRLAGNYIGLDAAGVRSLGAAHSGVTIVSPHNLIGTDGDGRHDRAEANVISGHALNIFVKHDTAGVNVIAGNFIGTDASGTRAVGGPATGPLVGTATVGVMLGGRSVRIGAGPHSTHPDAERNVISGNDVGVRIHGANNDVAGNFIGVDADGRPLANRHHGVVLEGHAQENVVGGEGPLANTIAHNGGAGVLVGSHLETLRNTIRANSIHSNGGLGIELQTSHVDGVTTNDRRDADIGPNDLQNFPVLTAATAGAETRVAGTLDSLAGTTFLIDVYANSSADPSGHGEGERWLGSIRVTTDAEGQARFDTRLAAVTQPGEHLTATATRLLQEDDDPAAPLVPADTSEFSAALPAAAAESGARPDAPPDGAAPSDEPN